MKAPSPNNRTTREFSKYGDFKEHSFCQIPASAFSFIPRFLSCVFLCLNLIDSVVLFGLRSITLSFLSPLYDVGSHPKGHILVDF